MVRLVPQPDEPLSALAVRVRRSLDDRVTDLVYERMGALLHMTPREARILVFGLTRRERRGAGQA